MYKCNQQSSKNAQKMMISLHENKDLRVMFRVIHLSDDNPRTINLLCSSKTESELRCVLPFLSTSFILLWQWFPYSLSVQCLSSLSMSFRAPAYLDNSWLCVGYSLMQISTQPSYLSQPPFLPLLQNGLNLSLRVLVYYLQNSSTVLRYE